MRRALVVLMLPVLALAQEAQAPIQVKEISDGDPRATTRQVLLTLYESEAVRVQCLKTPDKPIDVTMNGYKVPLECSLWNRWYSAEQERIRQAAEAAAETP